jgi:spore coat protein A, manganese oxidase
VRKHLCLHRIFTISFPKTGEDSRLPLTRRSFLQASGMLTMSAALHQAGSHAPSSKVRTQLNASTLTPFVDPLLIPEIARPIGSLPSPTDPGTKLPHYRIAMRDCEVKLHRDLKPTRMWGYAGTVPGPIFETRSGQGMHVEWVNELPSKHFLPIDHTIHGAEPDKPEVRTAVHLHGGRVPPESDGYPENWFVPGKSVTYQYPNQQEATLLWYHDHTLGINRLNVFAGLLGAFVVRDQFEDGLDLPRDKYEVPLILFDRILDLDSQLNYPVSPDPDKPWTPEVFGDAILINGKIFPYLEVEPTKYRFRLLNGSNARFFHLSFAKGPAFYQIGTDQGLLSAPVQLDRVFLAPGERADVIVDFEGLSGTSVILKNDILPVMQFRVGRNGVRNAAPLPKVLRPVPVASETLATKTRTLSLVEVDDLKQRPMTMLLNNTHWRMPVTENPTLNSTEIWELVNTTDDSHPIHLHLVRFQILDRRTFDVNAYWGTGRIKYKAPAVVPSAGESGWKDTVRADPGMVTRIVAKFEGFPGRYVWHCHILEHEDNEMMRPFDVIPAT